MILRSVVSLFAISMASVAFAWAWEPLPDTPVPLPPVPVPNHDTINVNVKTPAYAYKPYDMNTVAECFQDAAVSFDCLVAKTVDTDHMMKECQKTNQGFVGIIVCPKAMPGWSRDAAMTPLNKWIAHILTRVKIAELSAARIQADVTSLNMSQEKIDRVNAAFYSFQSCVEQAPTKAFVLGCSKTFKDELNAIIVE